MITRYATDMGEVLWSAKQSGMHGQGWAWLALDQTVDEAVQHLRLAGFADADSTLVQGVLKVTLRLS